MMRFYGTRFGIALSALLLVSLFGACDNDQDLTEFQLYAVNTTRSAANDLHVTISGTGGSLEQPVMSPDGVHCNPPPGVPVIAAGGNRVDVTWSSPCVQPGDTVGIVVKSRFRELEVVGVVWTLNGDTLRPGQ
jgi:hypothetical protein